MRDYKGYTHEQRMQNLYRVKNEIAEGRLENPLNMKCEICGMDKGIREYHCYDYNPEVALKSLRCLCYKCHRNLHIKEIGQSHKYYWWAIGYFNKIKKGFKYEPTYTSYYTKEMEDRGIKEYKYEWKSNR